MRVRDLIKELQEYEPNEFIAVSYWTQEDMQTNFLGDDELTEDEWEEITDNLTYELEDFSPDVIKEFFDDRIEMIRKRMQKEKLKLAERNADV